MYWARWTWWDLSESWAIKKQDYKKNRIIKTASFSISETLAVLLICCKTLLLPQGVFHQNDPLIHRQSAWTDQTYQIPCMKTFRQCCHVCMQSPTQLASLHSGKSDSFIPSIPLLSLFADTFSIAAFIFDSSTFHSQLYQYALLSAELLILLLTFLYNLSYQNSINTEISCNYYIAHRNVHWHCT